MPFDRELIEAKLALNLIPSADMPSIAWDAWEAGLDGPGTMRLGALEHPTYFEVSDVLPLVMRELGLSQVSRDEAALRLARRMVKEILESGDDPLSIYGPMFRHYHSLTTGKSLTFKRRGASPQRTGPLWSEPPSSRSAGIPPSLDHLLRRAGES